ncbi:uncharacterized protein [Montipora foliosa]
MCKMKTEDNKCCVFPFVFRGTTYSACTSVSGRKPWCSLSPNYDKDRQYGHCKGMEGVISGDDQTWVYGNGRYLGKDNGKWKSPTRFYFPANLQTVAVYVKNNGGPGGFLASFGNGIVTDASWKCTNQNVRNWQTAGFDDRKWPAAFAYRANSVNIKINGIASEAKWIGTRQRNAKGLYCRRQLTVFGDLPMIGGSCDKPLGLQSGWVKNSQMKASSEWSDTHAAWRGRLYTPKQFSYPGAWCARYTDTNQWLQAAFQRPVDITAIATQGRADYNQWVSSFTLSYSEDGAKFTVYTVGGQQKVFKGNSDKNTVVKHNIVPSITARFVRVHPKTWQGHISMRMELYGCLTVCKVDIGILMDESGSVSKADFERQKNFVKDLADHFEFGPNAAQFGVITYSTGAQLDITLSQYKTSASFAQRVNSIKHAGGWTFTGKALQLAYNQLFVAAKGARGNVAKVLLFITDGMATGGMGTLKAPIKRLKDSSVNIISVGVGKRTKLNELKFMASSPTNTHLFSVQNTHQLRTLIGSISESSCTTYNCRYVTCDYSQWSKWSRSCGIGMKRTQTLAKVNVKYIKQQGGCSGLKVTCDKIKAETKYMNCPCIRVTCSAWSTWSGWSATCGRMTRRRTSNAKQTILHRLNCNGLQTSCPKPEVQSLYISCCKGELGILMDESGSIGKEDFDREKGFVTSLADGFSNFGPNGIQMGVITYSTNAQLEIKLNQYSNKMEFIDAVKRITYHGGWTFTSKALTMAKNQLYQHSNGARSGVSKVLIVLTDGAVTGGMGTLRIPLKNLKKSNVNIFAIGVGSKVKKEELELMATEPIKDHVFYVANMQQLLTLLQRIGDSSCKKYKCKYVTCEYSEWSSWSSSCGTGMRRRKTLTKQTELIKEQQGGCSGLPTTCDRELLETKSTICPCKLVTCSWNAWGDWSATCGRMTRQRTSKVNHHVVNRPNCNGLQTTCPAPQTQSKVVSCCKVDFGVIMDESGSIRVPDFRRQKEFVAALAKSFNNFGPNGVRMGLITFSSGANIDIKLNQYSEKYGFMAAVRNVRQTGGNTNTDQALNLARTRFFTLSNGARSGVSKMALVITDGSSTGGIDKLRAAVKELKRMKVNIIAIGVGPNFNRQELEIIASDPIASHAFFVPNAARLNNFLQTVAKFSCQVFKCKYVTCDYSVWSSWSTSCGRNMKRKRTLTNETEHMIEQQGGCSGWQTTCNKEILETKDSNCPCKTVKCTWNPWTEWSATCGVAERNRSIQISSVTVQRPDCSGLPQTCTQPPQKETRKTMCTCLTVQCVWNQWSDWSATCGRASRSRTMRSTQVTVQKESCDGLPQSCPPSPETQNRTTNCACQTVNCTWQDWSSWSTSCGVGMRMRDINEIVISVDKPSCAGLLQNCTENSLSESREVNCTCPTVECRWNNWTEWSASCGLANRTRTIKTIQTSVQKLRCDGLPQSCPQPAQTQQRTTDCKCKTVNCEWKSWSSWSTTCGLGTRIRTINETVVEVLKPNCTGLPQSCSQPPQSQNREVKCSCPTVNCTWSQWSDWSATCGPATRQKNVTTQKVVVLRNSCDGLPQSCPTEPVMENRTLMCTCQSVLCLWGAWGNWSGECGMVNRTRHILQNQTTIEAESCDGFPKKCNQQPETEYNKLPECEECYTVECGYYPWSAWSATCGKANRRRIQLIEEIELFLPSCDGLPLECHGDQIQEQTRSTPPCPTTTASPSPTT